LQLDQSDAARFVHGTAIAVGDADAGKHAIFAGDELLGIGNVEDGVLRPQKVVVAEVSA
jgi:hypothetical protein